MDIKQDGSAIQPCARFCVVSVIDRVWIDKADASVGLRKKLFRLTHNISEATVKKALSYQS